MRFSLAIPLLANFRYNGITMAKQYTREELWKLYNTLPRELQEAIFSVETADFTGNACERNGVPNNAIPQVATRVGNVLMGLLLPDEFQGALVKEVGLKKDVAQLVAREIHRFVFYPVQAALAQIHHTGIGAQPAAQGAVPPKLKEEAEEGAAEQMSTNATPAEQEPQRKREKDSYREAFEEEQ